MSAQGKGAVEAAYHALEQCFWAGLSRAHWHSASGAVQGFLSAVPDATGFNQLYATAEAVPAEFDQVLAAFAAYPVDITLVLHQDAHQRLRDRLAQLPVTAGDATTAMYCDLRQLRIAAPVADGSVQGPAAPLHDWALPLGSAFADPQQPGDGGRFLSLYRDAHGCALDAGAPLQQAREQGARWAVLEASGAGLGLYQRLGFQPLFEYRTLILQQH